MKYGKDEILYVKIKTWDEMVEEFGFTMFHCIDTKYSRPDYAESLLPDNRVIKIIKINGGDKKDDYQWDNYFISEDMIEEVLTKEKYPEFYI
jgi:hypothetical protein